MLTIRRLLLGLLVGLVSAVLMFVGLLSTYEGVVISGGLLHDRQLTQITFFVGTATSVVASFFGSIAAPFLLPQRLQASTVIYRAAIYGSLLAAAIAISTSLPIACVLQRSRQEHAIWLPIGFFLVGVVAAGVGGWLGSRIVAGRFGKGET